MSISNNESGLSSYFSRISENELYTIDNVLIARDAAHINNPLGGMGMNFGFHDAFNLTEKLNEIWSNNASEDLLDLYERQRRTVASEYLQAQTNENKKNLERKDQADREQ